jgi:biopolymer transport protein ExbD
MNARSRKQRLIAEINITPFTDVILVLLIIFMITTPLILQSSIKVSLPNAASAKHDTNARSQVSISVTNENLLYLDNDLVTRKELREKVKLMHDENSAIEVILFSDKLVRFKDIVAVLDILNELGVKKLNIAAKTE